MLLQRYAERRGIVLLGDAILQSNRRIAHPPLPLTKDAVCKVRNRSIPALNFTKSCTKLANYASTVDYAPTRGSLLEARNEHKIEAATQFKAYRDLQKSCRDNLGTLIHFVFDFAAKVLISNLLW